jgi:hypothetical protein
MSHPLGSLDASNNNTTTNNNNSSIVGNVNGVSGSTNNASSSTSSTVIGGVSSNNNSVIPGLRRGASISPVLAERARCFTVASSTPPISSQQRNVGRMDIKGAADAAHMAPVHDMIARAKEDKARKQGVATSTGTTSPTTTSSMSSTSLMASSSLPPRSPLLSSNQQQATSTSSIPSSPLSSVPLSPSHRIASNPIANGPNTLPTPVIDRQRSATTVAGTTLGSGIMQPIVNEVIYAEYDFSTLRLCAFVSPLCYYLLLHLPCCCVGNVDYIIYEMRNGKSVDQVMFNFVVLLYLE